MLMTQFQDTLARKVNTSDASEYAHMIGCCGSRFWGGYFCGLNSGKCRLMGF